MNKYEIVNLITKMNSRPVWPIGWGGMGIHMFTIHNTKICKAFGFTLVQAAEGLTKVEPKPFQSVEEVRRYFETHIPDPEVYRADAEVIESLSSTEDIIFGGAFGLVTIAMDMIGFDRGLGLIRKDPQMLKAIVDPVANFLVEIACIEGDKGADLFWVAEPVASLMSPDHFWEICGEAYQMIFARIPMAGVLHVCGRTNRHTAVLEKTGAAVLSIDYCTDFVRALETVKKETIVMGNMNPMLLRDGPIEEIVDTTEAFLHSIRDYPNVIISTGCVIAPETPEENVVAWIETCRRTQKRANEVV